SPTARPAAGTFSPRRPGLQLDPRGCGPSVLARVVRAGAVLPRFELASRAPRPPADASIGGRPTEAVGAEPVARRGEQAERHRTRRLSPQVPDTPAAVVVEVDGGRHRRRAEGRGCGARDPRWREDGVARLATLESATRDGGPRPGPPDCFPDRRHVRHPTRGTAAGGPEIAGEAAGPEPASRPEPGGRGGRRGRARPPRVRVLGGSGGEGAE